MIDVWIISDLENDPGEPVIKNSAGLWACVACRDSNKSGDRITEKDAQQNAELIVASVNACRALNPADPLAAANALPDVVAALGWLVAAMDRGRPPVRAEGGYTGIFGSYEFDDARKALAALKGGAQ